MTVRAIPRERRNAKDQTVLVALIEAFEQAAIIDLKEHDLLSRPLVTSTMIERELKVSMKSALNLVAELGLREVTGRRRYRAWAVL